MLPQWAGRVHPWWTTRSACSRIRCAASSCNGSRGSEQRAGDLAQRLPVGRSAVSQHLRLMLEVGVVSERRDGRERYYSLRRDRLKDVDQWLARLDEFWARSLERLGDHLDAGA